MRFYNRQHVTAFLEVVARYRDDLVVAAECMFMWYWLADVCAEEIARGLIGVRR